MGGFFVAILLSLCYYRLTKGQNKNKKQTLTKRGLYAWTFVAQEENLLRRGNSSASRCDCGWFGRQPKVARGECLRKHNRKLNNTWKQCDWVF